MNGIEPRDQFNSEDELSKLLERWVAPETPKSLDKRVTNSYAREIANANLQADSALLSQKQKEVVAMKFCSTCQEEFADKFSFCPVDGTPLSSSVVRVEEPSVTTSTDVSEETQARVQPRPAFVPPAAVAAGGSLGFVPRGEYHLTIMDDAGLAQRLTHEVKDVAHEYELTWPEFKRDPFGFTKRTFVGYGQMAGRFLGNRNVLISMGASVFAMLGLVAAVAIIDRSHSSVTSHVALVVFAMIASTLLIALFATWMGKERGSAVMGAEPSDSRPTPPLCGRRRGCASMFRSGTDCRSSRYRYLYRRVSDSWPIARRRTSFVPPGSNRIAGRRDPATRFAPDASRRSTDPRWS